MRFLSRFAALGVIALGCFHQTAWADSEVDSSMHLIGTQHLCLEVPENSEGSTVNISKCSSSFAHAVGYASELQRKGSKISKQIFYYHHENSSLSHVVAGTAINGGSELCLDVGNGQQNEKVHVAKCDGSPKQQFELSKVGGRADGEYLLKNKATGICLSPAWDTLELSQWPCDGAAAWNFESVEEDCHCPGLACKCGWGA